MLGDDLTSNFNSAFKTLLSFVSDVALKNFQTIFLLLKTFEETNSDEKCKVYSV